MKDNRRRSCDTSSSAFVVKQQWEDGCLDAARVVVYGGKTGILAG